ncbi:MAG: FecR domain-containing protein [Candidatus Erginobacter occultus]|nr:FecR domain-containing protein [Candidatus Erginobacter occultus]
MRWFLTITILIFLAPVTRGEEEFVFFVREGDTARSLTENYLVRPTAWERVVQYNYILKPGNLIRVPGDLVRREEGAILECVFGEVSYLTSGSRDWLPAVPGLILLAGDRVRSGRAGSAVVRTGREDRTVLRSATEVAYEPSRGFFSGRINRVTVAGGTVIASTRKLADREARFVIKTPESELELTGTEIRVGVCPQEGSRFEVLEGEVVISTPAGKQRVPEGTGLRIEK